MRLMNRYTLLLLSFLILTGQSFAANAKRPWTFLVYMAADNNLNPDADSNIGQMVQASSNNNVNVLVYLTIKRSGESKKTQKLIIQNGKIQQEGATTVEDSGNVNTFIKALTWAATEYPSDHLLVDLWNHGSGSLNRTMFKHRGVCYDDTTGHYMTDTDLKHAFDILVNQYLGGKKIDIIAFDACLMADIEIAYALQPYANYQVSSQQTVPGPGYNYADVLSLFGQSAPDPLTLGHWMITSYDHYYKPSQESYTLSLIDLSKIPTATDRTKRIAQLLDTAIKADRTGKVAHALAACAAPAVCAHFDEPTYIDQYTFYENLSAYIPQLGLSDANATALKSALRSGMSALKRCVLYNAHSNSDYSKVHGISIYFADQNAGVEPSYNKLVWTSANPAWNTLMQDFVTAMNS